MDATSTAEPRRSRTRRDAEPETAEQGAIEPLTPTVDVQEGDLVEGSAPPVEEGEKPQEKRRRERKPDVIQTDAKLNYKVKLSVMLPYPVIWQLKHVLADHPDKTEGDIIEPLLAEYLKGFDYPRRPEWLIKLIEEEKERQRKLAEEKERQKKVSAA